MNRLRAALLLGSIVTATGVAAPAVPAAAPAGYTPGSPAGSEYQEQLATARELGGRDRQTSSAGAAAEDGSASSPAQPRPAGAALFGAGVTRRDDVRAGRPRAGERDAVTPRADRVAAAAGERAAIAAAANAPVDGPSPLLLTAALGAAALLAAGLLTLLLRRREPRGSPLRARR